MPNLSNCYLQVIGSGAHGAPRSVYVFTEQCRYLFNCGEGTQRLANEHKAKLSGLEHIYVTHKSWENVGGLPGMLLTLQDAGVKDISLHGPPGIDILYSDTKHFMRFNNLNINYCNYVEESRESGPLNITPIPILAECSSLGDITPSASLEDHNETTEEYELSRVNDVVALSYICKLPEKLGSLLPDECKRLKVPPGPLMGVLKQGKDITLEDGTVIKAVDVTTKAEPGPIFLVVEVPSVRYLCSFLSNPQLVSLYEKRKGDPEKIEVIVHFSPIEVVADFRYQAWMRRLSCTDHIIVNERSMCMGSERVHKTQFMLNHLYPPSFPLLLSDKKMATKKQKITKFSLIDTSIVDDGSTKQDNEIYQAFSKLVYDLRPLNRFYVKNYVDITPDEYIEECIKGNVTTFNYLERNDITIPDDKLNVEYPVITFLGTGSCIPNKTRNTSGILVAINTDTYIIMDCGEGTYGQIVRLMGQKRAQDVMAKLKAVYVSHLHADHHIGLIRLILARNAAREAKTLPLMLFAPSGITHYLSSYNKNFERIMDDVDFIPNYTFDSSRKNVTFDVEKISDICQKLSLLRIETCIVPHCANAYGISLMLHNNIKLTYSGDTMPSDNLIRIGQCSDILIHEATMEDYLKEDAEAKRHSTTSDAIAVMKSMNAKNMILTHFSQRYAKIPLISDLPPSISIAFDNMVVRLKDLYILPHLYESLKAIFPEDIAEMKEKTRKRKIKESLD